MLSFLSYIAENNSKKKTEKVSKKMLELLFLYSLKKSIHEFDHDNFCFFKDRSI